MDGKSEKGSARTVGSGRERAYDALRAKILTLQFAPGTPLSENDLATALGVSRTPVREAILLLTREGLVRVFPKVGTFVSRVDPAQVAEAQFLREAVELASLSSIPLPADPEILSRLEANLDEQDRVGDDVIGFFSLDEEFHRGLMALGGHEPSWSFVAAAKGHLDRARMLGITKLPILDHLKQEHRAVYDAVVAEDLDKARDELRAHLRTVFADIKTIETASPELFASDPESVPTRRSIAVWE
ncbi:MAG: GntR family transcriptional regulator [Actinomycetes bacterium]